MWTRIPSLQVSTGSTRQFQLFDGSYRLPYFLYCAELTKKLFLNIPRAQIKRITIQIIGMIPDRYLFSIGDFSNVSFFKNPLKYFLRLLGV